MKNFKLNIFYFIVIIILLKTNIIDCSIQCECTENYYYLIGLCCCSSCYCADSYYHSNCKTIRKKNHPLLNNIIVFYDGINYRAGRFSLDLKGNIIVEYSCNNKRLFYGLKTDGTYYFSGKPVKIVNNIKSNKEEVRYECNNIFISLENDLEKKKQYLFRIGSSNSVMELHDLENDINYIRTTENYLGHKIHSLVFPLLEFKYNNQNTYFLAYIYENTNKYLKIMTFSFQNFGLNNDEINIINEKYYDYNIINSRILSAFIMDNGIIVLFFIDVNNHKYVINIYEPNLSLKKEKEPIYPTQTLDNDSENGIFFKALYLKESYGAFIFFIKNSSGSILNLVIGKINYDSDNSIFSSQISKSFNNYSFQTKIILNDFQKFNEERLAFISTYSQNNKILYILIIDLFNDYTKMRVRVYQSVLNDYIPTNGFSTVVFNNYLVFTSTVYTSVSENEYFSILMIFGYANGTDSTIDISPYFMDDNENNDNNIVTDLIKNISIDNNIFGYAPLEKIKLVTIPEQIKFFDNSSIQLSNGTILDTNYKLMQNTELIKTDEFYFLEYQFIVEEPRYDNEYEIDVITYSIDSSSGYKEYQFYGRKNTLKFKLCHKYCESCQKFGVSNDKQLCMTCLEPYQYDYFKDFLTNCVPENHFKDKEDNYKLVECDNSNSRFYINITNNKKICFKSTYECPSEYPYLNISSNECHNYTFPTILDINNTEIYNKIKNEVIYAYSSYGKSFLLLGGNNYIFQLTTEENELEILNEKEKNDYNLSIIDLGVCEEIIKKENNIDPSINLIILKYEKLTDIISEKALQYEVYEPINKTQLDLSPCLNTSIDIYFPASLKERKDLSTDICEMYENEFGKGIDTLLYNRINDYHNNNETLFQSICNYSTYFYNSKFLKFECSIGDKYIDSERAEKYNEEANIENLFETLNYANFKFLKCYKLIFDIHSLTTNYGSILAFTNFLIYSSFLITFIIKGISPFKKLISNSSIHSNDNNMINNSNSNQKENENTLKTNNLNINNDIKTQNEITIHNQKNPQTTIKQNQISIPPKKNENSNKNIIINNNNNNIDTFNKSKKYKKKSFTIRPSFNPFIIGDSSSLRNFDISKIDSKLQQNNLNQGNVAKEKEKLSDLELNNLKYYQALELDKRPLHKIYFSILKREQLILFTFFSCNDYNLIYIKFAIFIFIVTTHMAMNILFFSRDSINKLYFYGKYDFAQHIPRIIFSIIISQIIQLFICYLCYTDKHFYKIKDLRSDKINKHKIHKILKCIKIKLKGFFSFSAVLFVFYWYLITTFYAVYPNARTALIKNFILSFSIDLIYPFILYVLPVGLRVISLKDIEKKRYKYLYRISSFIPIF